jgi:hypothetical protein
MIAKSVAMVVFFLSIFAAYAQNGPASTTLAESTASANRPGPAADHGPAAPRATERGTITAHDSATAPVYEVFAIRYASIPGFPVNALIAGVTVLIDDWPATANKNAHEQITASIPFIICSLFGNFIALRL